MTYYQLGILSLIALCLIAVHFGKLYGIKSLLYPGMLFCILWIATIGSSLLSDHFHGEYETLLPVYMQELFIFVLITALSFFVTSFFGYKRIQENNPQLSLPGFDILYKYVAIVCLIFSIIHFIITGGSLNLARMRAIMVEHETEMFYQETKQTMLSTFLGISNMFNWMLQIYAGMLLARKWNATNKQNVAFSGWMLLCPLLTCIINALTVGGRAILILGLRLYFFGAVLTFCAEGFSKTKLKRAVQVLLVIIVVFSIYSNYNANQRRKETGIEIRTEVANIPVLGNFSSIINYLSSATLGYQLRRDDYVTAEPDHGVKTFGGLLFWQIPFSGLLEENLSLGDFLGMERTYTMKQMFLELQENRTQYFSLVATIYMTMYDDFGFYGTIVAIMIMVIATQFFYYLWFCHDHKNLFSFYFLLLFFWMWSNSIFDSVFVAGYAKQILNMMIVAELLRFFINSSARYRKGEDRSNIRNKLDLIVQQ